MSRFEKGAGGAPKPHSELLFLRRRGGRWEAKTHEDPTAPVFHKALVYPVPGEGPAILTLGGSVPGGPAALKLWHKAPDGLRPETVWEANFGGKFSRMRDAEIADLDARRRRRTSPSRPTTRASSPSCARRRAAATT